MVDELKTIFDMTEGSAPALTDYALTGEDPAGNHVLRRTTWQSLKNLFMSDVTTQANNGWIPAAGPWTYNSASVINVPAGSNVVYSSKFTKIRFVQHGVTKYFYWLTATSNTVSLYAGSSYTVEDTATYPITDPLFSVVADPVGFPFWFNYTPTGISASNVTLLGRFCVVGRTCKVQFKAAFTGGITFTTMPTLPIAAASTLLDGVAAEESVVGVASYVDQGTSHNPTSLVSCVLASGTTFALRLSAPPGTAISATSPITWANGDYIHAQFEYEI